MAITLVTGKPGHGKTLWTLQRIRDEAAKSGRPVYHNGIRDLKLPWQVWDVEKWQQLPPNAIFVVDEAQFSFPLRGRSGANPPAHVEQLAVHRHSGIDIFVVTQDPMLIDAFLRRLVDRHFHVIRKFGTHWATVYEYPAGVREMVSRSRGDDAIRHEWRYPKDVFDLYTSAEVHTVKRHIPLRVWFMFIMPIIALVAGWFAVQRLSPSAQKQRAAAAVSGAASGPSGAGLAYAGGPGGRQGPLPVAAYVEMHKPRIAGLAYTAAAYDEVTKPVEAPYPAACVRSETRCQCYSQQGTRLDVPADLCDSIVSGGFFVAWRPGGMRSQEGGRRSEEAPPAPPPVLAGGPGAGVWGFNGERRLALSGQGAAPAVAPPGPDAGAPGGAPPGAGRPGRRPPG